MLSPSSTTSLCESGSFLFVGLSDMATSTFAVTGKSEGIADTDGRGNDALLLCASSAADAASHAASPALDATEGVDGPMD